MNFDRDAAENGNDANHNRARPSGGPALKA